MSRKRIPGLETRRLSLSNIHEQISIIRSSEWPTVKRYFKRKIAKAVNECKTQATNAKKLMESIETKRWHTKRHSKAEYDDDDNTSWGSEFDDDTDDEEESDEDLSTCGSYSFGEKNSRRRQHQLNGIMATGFENTYESVYETPSSSSCGESSEHSSCYETASENVDEKQSVSNVVFVQRKTNLKECISTQSLPETHVFKNENKKCDVITHCSSPNTKPLTSTESLSNASPKPYPTKSPNKPAVPPKPNLLTHVVSKNAEVTKRLRARKIVRPPSEPPPPPLPKSPPPVSTGKQLFPELTLTDLNTALESEPPQDEYEPPICVVNHDPSFRSPSSSSSQNRSSDSDSGSGYLPFWVSPPPGFDDKDSKGVYEPMISSAGSTPNLSPCESNYEAVPEEEYLTPREKFLGSTISLSTAELNRPKLPRVKLNNNVGSTLSLRFPEKFKLLPEKLMKSEKSLNAGDSPDNRRDRSNSITSLNPAHRPLPPVPPNAQRHSEDCGLLHNYDWFHDIEREEAAVLLESFGQEGGYLVRESKRAGRCNPYSLTIYHDNKIFHLNIRRRNDGLYALGKQKEREKTFRTVPELIGHHQKEPILLTTKGQPAGTTKLSITPQR